MRALGYRCGFAGRTSSCRLSSVDLSGDDQHVSPGASPTSPSRTANDLAVAYVCRTLGYAPVIFTATDQQGIPTYHTNVMMSIGTTMALVGLDAIPIPHERTEVRRRLEESCCDIIALSQDQIDAFAGNAMEVQGRDGNYLVMSQRAHDSAREPTHRDRRSYHAPVRSGFHRGTRRRLRQMHGRRCTPGALAIDRGRWRWRVPESTPPSQSRSSRPLCARKCGSNTANGSDTCLSTVNRRVHRMRSTAASAADIRPHYMKPSSKDRHTTEI
jgi:hypothetical protein